jgi:hypothetical protein
MSIGGPSGDQSQAINSATGWLACRTSRPAGYDCQKFFTLIPRPPPKSPTDAKPAERWPAAENSHVLFGFVRFTIVKPSGLGCDSLKSSQIAFCPKSFRAGVNAWPAS